MLDPRLAKGWRHERSIKRGTRCRDPLTLLGVAATGVGSIMSASAAKQQGRDAAAAAEVQAQQAERAAMEKRAQASREASQKYADQRELLSNQQAVAGASGGGATDPTLLELAGDIGGYGYEQRQIITANGENQARGLEDDAAARRREGKSALRAGKTNSAAALLSGFTSAAKTYKDLMPKVPR